MTPSAIMQTIMQTIFKSVYIVFKAPEALFIVKTWLSGVLTKVTKWGVFKGRGYWLVQHILAHSCICTQNVSSSFAAWKIQMFTSNMKLQAINTQEPEISHCYLKWLCIFDNPVLPRGLNHPLNSFCQVKGPSGQWDTRVWCKQLNTVRVICHEH